MLNLMFRIFSFVRRHPVTCPVGMRWRFRWLVCASFPLLRRPNSSSISASTACAPTSCKPLFDAGSTPNFKRFQDRRVLDHQRPHRLHAHHHASEPHVDDHRPARLAAGRNARLTHHGYTDNVDPPQHETLHNLPIPTGTRPARSTCPRRRFVDRSVMHQRTSSSFTIKATTRPRVPRMPTAGDKIDTFADPRSPRLCKASFYPIAANHFNYTFVHYADTDDAGHGWLGNNRLEQRAHHDRRLSGTSV